jgi:hypothetical protein
MSCKETSLHYVSKMTGWVGFETGHSVLYFMNVHELGGSVRKSLRIR